MLPVVSDQLAARYSLQLDDAWREWFDEASSNRFLTGRFQSPIDVQELLSTAPPDVWPGFMLPDSLPIVSNDYGDWWCLRAGADNRISEVIQWSHGGGDWLPIGDSIGQAVLWDHLEIYRSRDIEVEHAAHEYPARSTPSSTDDLTGSHWHWLARSLNIVPAEIEQLANAARDGQYRKVLEELVDRGWSISAAGCELVEIALQGRLSRLADPAMARHCGLNWTPDYASWLFDTRHISPEARRLLQDFAPSVEFTQDWDLAERAALQVMARRGDLAWAGDIAGWAAERRGELGQAISRYFENRHSPAFTDQSVRLRSHWFPERYGKFSIAQLARLEDQLTVQQRSDPYLNLLLHEPVNRTRTAVRAYWLEQARAAVSRQHYSDAYHLYLLAGWDLGAERMSDYIEIIDELVRCATLAGWDARAAIISTHAHCLRGRNASHL